MTLGLVLGSGGARGWCHIGVLRALDEMGVEPELVAGCSMGALVGAAWAAGRLDALEDWARAMTRTRLLAHMDLKLTSGLVGGGAVAEILADLGLPMRFDGLQKPFIAVASSLHDGREVWMQEGDLLSAIRASISIPGAFSPHYHDGRWLLDGGLTNPVPVSAARALGASHFIAVNPNARNGAPLWSGEGQERSPWWGELGVTERLPERLRAFLPEPSPSVPKPRALEVMDVSISVMTDYVRATRLAADPPDVLIETDLQQIDSLELYRADEAIADGYAKAMALRDRICAIGRPGQTV